MTFGAVAQANSKTAEFARLFELFDRVATRRTRALKGDTSEPISADDIANVPVEFAPVLMNLSTILSSRARSDEERARRAQVTSTTQERHASLVGALSAKPTIQNSMRCDGAIDRSDGVATQDPESPTFPLGERYPFTFKLMLHKLYDLDEWADKVKHALETSKSQFKPLAERVRNIVKDATTNIKERGEIRSSGASGRSAPGVSTKSRLSDSMRYSHSGFVAQAMKPLETGRVLKKRCIGRRKSVSGPMLTGVWVYDAAISAMEVMGSSPSVEITLSTTRDTGGMGGSCTLARHRSLTILEEKSKVKIAIPPPQEQRFESTPGPGLPQPSWATSAERAQLFIERGSVVKRRKSVAFTLAP